MTLALGALIRRWLRRATSLRRIVVTVVLASLSLGVLSAALAARLMLLDGAELRAFLAVLIVAAAFAVVLAVYVARPLAVDIRRLEATVRSIEAGDRAVTSGIVRADELGHVARALDDLTGRLDTLERERAAVEDERRTLLSSVGHDLRTPLASIRAAVEALVDGVAADPDRYLRAMQHDVTALTALVDDLFLLSKLDAGRADLDRVAVDLAELTDETLDSLAPIAAERGVELRLIAPTAVPVFGSPTALSRVVRNLVDNAIRHAPSATAVSVSVVRGASERRSPGRRDGARARPGARLPGWVPGHRLRPLLPLRSGAHESDRRRRPRPVDRPGTGRGPRRRDLDRRRRRRPGLVPHPRPRLTPTPPRSVAQPRTTRRSCLRVRLRMAQPGAQTLGARGSRSWVGARLRVAQPGAQTWAGTSGPGGGPGGRVSGRGACT